MSETESIIFAIVFTVAVLVFILSVTRLVRLIRLGQPDSRLRGNLMSRFWSMVEYAFGQKRVVAEKYGFNHFLLFWGFMILVLANMEFVVAGIFRGFSFRFLGPVVYPALTLTFDIISVVVLACVAVALFRRLVVKPDHIDHKSADAFVILGLIAALMIVYFALHGAEIAAGDKEALMPVSEHVAAPVLAGLGLDLHLAARVFWWTHSLILLGFLNYLPHSKHMHILAAIPNCFCRAFEPVSTVPREEFKVGNTYGASKVDQFTWKDLLDFTACTECGRCNANCPATITEKPLNPRLVIHDCKVNLLVNGDNLRHGNRTQDLLSLISGNGEIDGSVGEEALWACTTCGACMANCPVFIEHVPKIIKMRRHIVQDLSRFPGELNVVFEAMEQRFNPWGIAPSDRAKWAKDLDVADVADDGGAEYLFFVGCAGAFDSRNKKVATAVVKALKAAGVSFAILGSEEKCCGDSARRLGNEFVFDRLAAQNVEMFKKYGAKKIICYCPHCYTTLKNDYKQFGLDAEVFHHSEFLLDLAKEGRLPLTGEGGGGPVVFHDSCYLGRYNGLYQEPRDLIARTIGSRPIEMNRSRSKSFCCGAGGGRMWMEENPENRINTNRVREALSKNPEVIAVACPYCLTMFEDGVKDENATDRVRVLDIAEMVAERIRD